MLRNRIHLNVCPSTPTTEFSTEKDSDENDCLSSKTNLVISVPCQRSPIMTRSRTGSSRTFKVLEVSSLGEREMWHELHFNVMCNPLEPFTLLS